ncbi:MAG TPA: thioredoxin-like domain-containing protein [Flavitalea sp.]|nr:thioredoxin-like domain-containing protein [Flavitalea sp.]
MLKSSFVILLIAMLSVGAVAQTAGNAGHDIAVSLTPVKNQWVYLGFYYGKIKALADSTRLDNNSAGHFKGEDRLPGGIYFLVSPKKEILFEILIDKNQHFSIKADSANLPAGISFDGSLTNQQFQKYSLFAGVNGSEMAALQQKLAEHPAKPDSVAIIQRSKVLSQKMQQYRDSAIKADDSSFLALLFKAMKEPEIPPASSHPGGKYDSQYAFQYYRAHYWDGISFADERLVRTPFFEQKVDKYFQELVVPQADSIIREVDNMLLQARTSNEMFQFLLVKFVQQYVNPQYMGHDAVFVHLFEKYINAGRAPFFTAQYREFIDKRAYSLMANLIGKPAADLQLVDTSGKQRSLYEIKAPYTVVVFWDPTCGHCKEVVPKVDSIFKAKWAKMNIKVFGVKVDGSREEWIKFIQEHDLRNWEHVYQTTAQHDEESKAGRPNFRQLYDVYSTPMLYLLDKDKKILAKKLTYLQIDDVINVKSRKS